MHSLLMESIQKWLNRNIPCVDRYNHYKQSTNEQHFAKEWKQFRWIMFERMNPTYLFLLLPVIKIEFSYSVFIPMETQWCNWPFYRQRSHGSTPVGAICKIIYAHDRSHEIFPTYAVGKLSKASHTHNVNLASLSKDMFG